MDQKLLGQRLQEARKGAGFSMEAAGALCSVTRSAVSQWESGTTLPGLNHVATLAGAYRRSIDWLVGRPTPSPGEAYSQIHAPEVRRIINRLQYLPPDCIDAVKTLAEAIAQPFDPRYQAFERGRLETWKLPNHGIQEPEPPVPTVKPTPKKGKKRPP